MHKEGRENQTIFADLDSQPDTSRVLRVARDKRGIADSTFQIPLPDS
jgi:hypothetical protein